MSEERTPKLTVLQSLVERGWSYETAPGMPFELPSELRARYPLLPSSLALFHNDLKSCWNRLQTAWFVCRDDFAGESDSEWRWNEMEEMMLVWAEDEAEKAAITRFWDTHIPVLLSMHSGYAYFAMSLRPETAGRIVHGLLEADLDETATVAQSLPEFLTMLAAGKFPAETGDG